MQAASAELVDMALMQATETLSRRHHISGRSAQLVEINLAFVRMSIMVLPKDD